MKKFASSFLALSMAMMLPMVQVQAQETSLESAISTLQYRLTVEWDQKDIAAQKKIMSDFTAQIGQLQKDGVTNDQIFGALSSKAFDAQTSKDIENLAKYAKSKNLDQKQVRKLVVDYANKSQKLGTSWSGDAALSITIGILVAVVLIVVLTSPHSSSSVGVYYDCYDDCYYDVWGYYYCDTYCY